MTPTSIPPDDEQPPDYTTTDLGILTNATPDARLVSYALGVLTETLDTRLAELVDALRPDYYETQPAEDTDDNR